MAHLPPADGVPGASPAGCHCGTGSRTAALCPRRGRADGSAERAPGVRTRRPRRGPSGLRRRHHPVSRRGARRTRRLPRPRRRQERRRARPRAGSGASRGRYGLRIGPWRPGSHRPRHRLHRYGRRLLRCRRRLRPARRVRQDPAPVQLHEFLRRWPGTPVRGAPPARSRSAPRCRCSSGAASTCSCAAASPAPRSSVPSGPSALAAASRISVSVPLSPPTPFPTPIVPVRHSRGTVVSPGQSRFERSSVPNWSRRAWRLGRITPQAPVIQARHPPNTKGTATCPSPHPPRSRDSASSTAAATVALAALSLTACNDGDGVRDEGASQQPSHSAPADGDNVQGRDRRIDDGPPAPADRHVRPPAPRSAATIEPKPASPPPPRKAPHRPPAARSPARAPHQGRGPVVHAPRQPHAADGHQHRQRSAATCTATRPSASARPRPCRRSSRTPQPQAVVTLNAGRVRLRRRALCPPARRQRLERPHGEVPDRLLPRPLRQRKTSAPAPSRRCPRRASTSTTRSRSRTGSSRWTTP